MSTKKRERGHEGATQAPLSHDAYTVGWVCALPKEQTAAIAMLDQRHPSITNMQPPTDTNAYTLGSMGNHNIVIACLPKGQIGVVSATTVATNMVSTFPSVRIGLMVGIGGGVPSNKVRLGDIVVSTPTGAYPGVVQWDLGKAKHGGKFERTGSLNNPPTFLLAALAKLETSHEMEGPKIEEYLAELERKFPKLASKYLRSDALRDILFKADYAHVDAESSSSDEDDEPNVCRHCDKTKAKERKLRDTRIHYGLIASGNQVIKDGITRDKLNEDLGGQVLCVDMEAAGLMMNFPCLVVRGVCDYADSHKNKQWQEHAAAVAAAFAKEFLAQIEPGTIHAERSANNILKNINDAVSATAANLYHMRSHLLKEEDLKILDWLTPVDYGKQHSDLFSRHQQGTGRWFLESEPFEIWLKSQGNTLFCPGIPGSGKTTITSIVVNFLQESFKSQGIGLAYVYCNYQSHNEQKLLSLLASILKQLCQTRPILPEIVRKLHKKRSKWGENAQQEELIEAISEISRPLSKVFFVADALDECQISEDCRSKFIHHLSRIQNESGVNVMYTSRHVLEIENLFLSCLRQPIKAQRCDVSIVVESQLPWILQRVQGGNELGPTIKSAITNLADGMFLLAQLYLDVIKDTTSVAEVRKALKQLEIQDSKLNSDDEKRYILEKVYDQAVARIKNQPPNFRRLGMRTLMWIVFARRPLARVELQHALAIEESDVNFDPEKVRTIERILSTCAGLVTIDEKSDTVRLAHFTTQEYFMAKQNEYFPSAQSDITVACVTYLCFEGLWKHVFCHRSRTCSDLVCQLAGYAANNWGHHARKHEESTLHASSSVIDLLIDEKLVGYAWAYGRGMRLYQPSVAVRSVIYHLRYRVGAYGLHVAIQHKLLRAAEALIEHGADLDYNPDGTQTPLMAAAAAGNERLVRLLVDNGAVVDREGRVGSNALVAAWKGRHQGVVAMLLDEGASLRRAIEISEESSNKDDFIWLKEKFGPFLSRLPIKMSMISRSSQPFQRLRRPPVSRKFRKHPAGVVTIQEKQ